MIRDLREYFAGCGYYLMRREDVGAFVECACEAYGDYPLMKWFFECDEKVSRIFWRANLLTLMHDTAIFATSEKAEGFAIVAPEGFVGESTLGFIINGGYKVPISALLRMSRYESYIKRQRMKFVGRDCIYFYNLSVRNDCQGKGIGSGTDEFGASLLR